jgi:hypothetical protein
MSTRANPMAGRYFNDPGIAAAVSNLAGAFAPPSAQEYLLAEQVKGARTTNSALADLYAQAGGDFDKLGIVADLYDPSNSYYSVDTESADRRYNTDVTADTALDKARIDGMFGLAGTPLAYNEVMPGLSPEVAAAIGVPEFAPQAGAALGAPAPPLNESEMIAQIMAEQSPEDQRSLLDPSTVQTVGPDGQPVITPEIDAIGMDAYNNPGGQAAATAITFDRGGVRMGGFITPDGKYTDSNGGPLTPEEAGTAAEVGKPVGTNSELGITGSNRTSYNNIQAITTESDMLIDSLAAEIDLQKGAVGFAGTLQNLQQNVGQVFAELNSAFGGEDGVITPEMLSGLTDTGQPYDPTFARLRSGMLQLAYLNAQRDNPSGEVSRFALERQLEALSQGMLANDQSFLAALAMNKEANARKRAASKALLGGEVVPPDAPPAGGTGATGATTVLRFDANGDPLP